MLCNPTTCYSFYITTTHHRIENMSNNAYNHNTSDTHKTGVAISSGLTFTSHSLFRAIEDILTWRGTCAPCSNDTLVQTLTKMLDELERFGIRGYWRSKAFMNYHSDALRKARKAADADHVEGDGIGVAWLLASESPFRELAKAYFDIAKMDEAWVRKNKRKGMVIG